MRGNEGARIMSVADYAKARKKTPQVINYYLRKKDLVPDFCECGRTCINVEEADLFFQKKENPEEDKK